MRLYETAIKSAVHLGVQLKPDEHDVLGTGFFIKAVLDNVAATYLVTARHVVKPWHGCTLTMRANLKTGGSRRYSFTCPEWQVHSDESAVDIAIVPFPIPKDADIVPIDLDVKTDNEMREKRIGPGTPIYIPGLFDLLHGHDDEQMITVVHTGHIAVLPDGKQIPSRDSTTGNLGMAYGYVVQVQSINGLSGAPAFVRRPVMVPPIPPPYENAGSIPEGFGAQFLLGVWKGAWGGERDDTLNVRPKKPKGKPDDPRVTKVPVGFGVITPAQKIVEILQGEKMKALRQKIMEKHIAARAVEEHSTKTQGLDLSGDDILRAALNTAPIRKQKPKAKGSKRARGGVSSK